MNGSPRSTERLLILAGITVATAVIVGVVWLAGSSGNEGEPAPVIQPTSVVQGDLPLGESCRVAPRPLASFLHLVASPTVASPVAPATAAAPLPQDARPADPAISSAVRATYREVTACGNVGDFSRAFALYSDDYARALLLAAGQATRLDPRTVAVALATPMTAQVPPTVIVSMDSVALLPDGRVTATVITRRVDQPPASAEVKMVVFVRRGDRWLIDGIERPPEAATPAPVAGTP